MKPNIIVTQYHNDEPNDSCHDRPPPSGSSSSSSSSSRLDSATGGSGTTSSDSGYSLLKMWIVKVTQFTLNDVRDQSNIFLNVGRMIEVVASLLLLTYCIFLLASFLVRCYNKWKTNGVTENQDGEKANGVTESEDKRLTSIDEF